MDHPIAQRVSRMQPFLAMEILERALELEREGIDVVHLELGEPDFPPPPEVTRACAAALAAGDTHYTDSRGEAELREAIADDVSQRSGQRVGSDRVLVTSGTSPAMLLVFSLLVDPGDEVLIASPHYPCYPNFVRYCGGVPIPIATRPEDGYALAIDDVKGAITKRTRAIVLGSPANPTGAIQSAETVQALGSFGLPVVSDEIYDGLVYEGARVTSGLSSGPDAFVLDGFSKRYAMTGFRLGFVVAPEWAVRPLQIMQQNLFISANPFVQRAGLAALAHGAPHVARMRDAYAARRTQLIDGLRALGFGIPTVPQGAFYVLADASHLGELGGDSRRLASRLLERAHVGVTPGIDFGEAAEGKLRFTYAASPETLERGLARIARVLPTIGEPT